MDAAKSPRRAGFFMTLVAADLRNVARDGLMATIIVAPVAVALIFRLFVPETEALTLLLAPHLGAASAAELAGAAPVLLMSLLMAVAPGLVGAVFGLLLVDERDQRTLMALRVMPVSFARYVAARLATPLALSTVMTLAAYPIAGLAPLPFATILMLALVSATSAPMVALGMAALARDKVMALAVMRVINSVLALPVLAYFAMPPMLHLAWLSPAYWQMKALWLAGDATPFAAELGVALAMNIVLTWLLYTLFHRSSEA